MKRPPIIPSLLAAAFATMVASTTHAQDASKDVHPPPGERLVRRGAGPAEGRLASDPTLGFVFQPGGASRPMPLVPGDQVEFRPRLRATAAGRPPFRLDLGLGQQLLGQLRSIDGREIVLVDPTDGRPVRVARNGVHALLQTPGETQVLSDSFESVDPSRWTIQGKVEPSTSLKLSGAASLAVPRGSQVVNAPREPIASGRLEVAYHDDGKVVGGSRCLVELTFRGPTGPEVVRAVVGWMDEGLALESIQGPALAVQRLGRSPGWHRLSVRFGPERCEASVDGNELAHGKGPGGPLVEIKLAAGGVALPGESTPRVGYFDDLRLLKISEAVGTPEMDASQDEARLTTGDQVFGQIDGGTADGPTATVAGREVSFSWSEVAGIYFRREGRAGVPIGGTLVRVAWQADPSRDDEPSLNRVEGALEKLSDETLRVATAYCGLLEIRRDRLVRLDVLGKATRLVVDSYAHHLGDEISSTPPLLDPPEPEGGVLERSVELDRLPAGPAWLVLDLVQVVSESPDASADPRFSALVKKGELRTNVAINGNPFDYLNRYITSRNETPERVRIPLPKGSLRRGKNVIRLEQVGIASDPNYLDDLGVVGVALEWDGVEPAASPRP